MEKGTLYGVSIGPGDPELITVKAMKVIERSKYIATPETGTSDSLALSIVSDAVDLSAKEIMGLSFPMTKDAEILARSHKEAADSIAEVLDSGNDVAMLNLGDITVYSTFAYVMNILLERDYDVELNGIHINRAWKGNGETLILETMNHRKLRLQITKDTQFLINGESLYD